MKTIKLQLFFIMCLSITSQAASVTKEISSPEKDRENVPILEGWQNFENKVKTLINSVAVPLFTKKFGSLNLSEDCMGNINYLISGLKELEPWAVKFIDSSGKVPDGILEGSFSSFGSFDECLDIEVKNRVEPPFRGQYCTIMMQPPLPYVRPNYMDLQKVPDELKNFSQRNTAVAELSRDIQFFYVASLRLGVCIPSGCSIHDVDKMAQLLGKEFSLEATTSRCEVKEQTTFTTSAILVIILYSFFGFLVLVGSSIDIYAGYSRIAFENIVVRVLLSFSFNTNWKKLTAPVSKSEDLSCLHGMRSLGAMWIIAAHSVIFLTSGLTHGLKESKRIREHFSSQVFANGNLSVDTFLFMGGMLVCYRIIKSCKVENTKLNIFEYLIHRVWRILPSYFFILVATFVMPILGSGPMWHELLDPIFESCDKNWWANLLFIQNFYDTEHYCFTHYWYVAVDFQLYVFALLILLPMLKWPKAGVSLAILTIIASISYSGIVTYLEELPPTVLFTVNDFPTIVRYAFKRFLKPFIHAGPYTIGILTGYLLSSMPKIKMPAIVLVCGWCLSFISTFSVLNGALPWYRGQDTSTAAIIAFASLNRVTWTLGIAWMTFCCANGNGGIINRILSMRVFVPLGRLSYLAYLIHFPMQYIFTGNIRTRLQSDRFFLVCIFCGQIVLSYVLAFFLNMLVEAPFMNLEKICFAKRGKKEENIRISKGQDAITMDSKSEKHKNNIPVLTIPVYDVPTVNAQLSYD